MQYYKNLHISSFNKKLEFLDFNRASKYRGSNTRPTKYRMNNTNNSNELRNSYYENKNKHRKIIWFKLPFYKLTNLNIDKYFVNLIDKHFQKNNILSKI